jgi:hypothetical protein
MIVRYFNPVWPFIHPHKTNPELIINCDAVLPSRSIFNKANASLFRDTTYLGASLRQKDCGPPALNPLSLSMGIDARISSCRW